MTLSTPIRSAESLAAEVAALFHTLGRPASDLSGGTLDVHSPVTGETLAALAETDAAGVARAIEAADAAFAQWRLVPAPQRGELVRLLGESCARTRHYWAGWYPSRSAR